MSKYEKAVFTNMCMIYDDKGKVLVQNRCKSTWPGITFPGGHVEYGESFVDSVIREVEEETGLQIKNPILCGVKQFQDNQDARYVVFLFKANQYEGVVQSSEEGEVFWVEQEKLREYPLAHDFSYMLDVFEQDRISELYYDYRTSSRTLL